MAVYIDNKIFLFSRPVFSLPLFMCAERNFNSNVNTKANKQRLPKDSVCIKIVNNERNFVISIGLKNIFCLSGRNAFCDGLSGAES